MSANYASRFASSRLRPIAVSIAANARKPNPMMGGLMHSAQPSKMVRTRSPSFSIVLVYLNTAPKSDASPASTEQISAKDIANDAERDRTMAQGYAECMSPPIMGFGFLTLAAMLAAVGRRRLDAKRDA